MSKQPVSSSNLLKFFDLLAEDLNEKAVVEGSPKQFAIQRQVQRMRKRAKINNKELRPKAFADFISLNNLVGEKTVNLSPELVTEARYFILRVLENYTSSVDPNCIQEVLDGRHLYDMWKYGPGSSNGIEFTHACDKIAQDMTCTVECEPLVVKLRKENVYFHRFDADNGRIGTRVVKGSQLLTVLKNEDSHRTICKEPVGNMALQLAGGCYLEGALRSIGLDIRTQQPRNMQLACIGSIAGSIATIDLKSASDMFLILLIRELFPAKWFAFFMKTRSQFTKVNGKWIRLNMMSTMGNGFTFPMMTLVIVSLIYAMRRLKNGPSLYIDWSRTAVFGDDIIVPVGEYDELCGILSDAGLIVNHDKSFASGDFRESCGGDFYKGVNVTPFYVRSLDSKAAIYVALNQVLTWAGEHNCLPIRALLFLRSLLPGRCYLVPEWENADSGVQTSEVGRRYKYLKAAPWKVYYSMDNHFAMMLVAGGYLTECNDDTELGFSSYVPRQYKKRYVTKKATLPNGFVDGRHPPSRSDAVSNFISSYSFLLD